ncbi:capsular polysaccharide biosynthesis/export periplasmic protein WcbA [Vibrio maritimus]|uniref:Capsular polysaccharide biosynthesis/export periplasmic protein WcbA n=1 Tax=Vibrio maritimus TaxID=990268 RepID=A0A090S6E7_9VIBR|nr:capsular polysaccharide biosynthesis/export periplasmic protein WcbA [Vibrio maritimus]
MTNNKTIPHSSKKQTFKSRATRVLTSLSIALLLSSPTLAQTPTPQQMEMFKSLPASQQQALAAQYGVTLPTSTGTTEQFQNPQVMNPRVTDETANPADTTSSTTEESAQNEDTELKRFGIELFAASPSTFAPISDVPVPAEYHVGPGDEIVIQLFGKDNQTHRLRVNREGVINFPTLGPVQVGGMSFSNVRESLQKRVREQMIGVRSDVTMGELRTMQIFVMGDAYKPGAYTVSGLTTISQAIYYSGGFSESGALRDIQLKRNGKLIRRLDMYDMLLKGDTRNDVRLMPGDVVFIGPVKNTIEIDGEVNRPAIYEIQPGESYAHILNMAAGLTANAYADQVQVKRAAKNGIREVLTLALNKNAGLNTKAKNGDQVTVGKRSDELKNFVQVEGDVLHPGYYQWRSGTKLSHLFSGVDTAFNSTADVHYALVVREVNPQRDIRVFQVDLANAIMDPSSKDNLLLSSRDRVLVFNRFNLEELEALTQPAEQESTAKTFEQARQQSFEEELREKQTHDTALQQVDNQKIQLIYQGQEVDQEQIDKVKQSTRQALLAPILMQLRQQAVYGHPPLIAEVGGEVKHPGNYPIASGTTVKDLVEAAGGLTPDAFIMNAELSRNVFDAQEQRAVLDVSRINLGNALLGDVDENMQVGPRDRLNVLEQPYANLRRTVTLRGEVRFPGTYSVRQGETMSELIERAGGLTKFAHPQGAIFTREALRLQEEKQLNQYAADIRKETAKKTFRVDNNLGSTITDPEKTLAFVEEASKSKALGRMVVQLDQITGGNESADFMLEDGDFLFVPTFRNSISIMGEVQVSITYLLDNNLDVSDYLNKAGGIKKQADEDRIFVVRADGSVYKPNSGYWFGNNNEELMPGDTIVVPIDTDYRDALSTWTAATQILYQIGVAVNAINK